jgi:hypothetical protein
VTGNSLLVRKWRNYRVFAELQYEKLVKWLLYILTIFWNIPSNGGLRLISKWLSSSCDYFDLCWFRGFVAEHRSCGHMIVFPLREQHK